MVVERIVDVAIIAFSTDEMGKSVKKGKKREFNSSAFRAKHAIQKSFGKNCVGNIDKTYRNCLQAFSAFIDRQEDAEHCKSDRFCVCSPFSRLIDNRDRRAKDGTYYASLFHEKVFGQPSSRLFPKIGISFGETGLPASLVVRLSLFRFEFDFVLLGPSNGCSTSTTQHLEP